MEALETSHFENLLAPQVRWWIHQRGWSGLREIQQLAIEPILSGRDVIITSDTAGGKTEAAYFPICTRLARRREPGVNVIYVSPLKALINDQYRRIESLCLSVGMPVCSWHGDALAAPKRALLKVPSGVLLITPESLEALFVRRGMEVARLFAGLDYVIVDELHAFPGTERGRQLQSLLHRLDLACQRRVPRVALSATISGFEAAADFLRPGDGASVEIINPTFPPRKIRLLVKGYVNPKPPQTNANEEASVQQNSLSSSIRIPYDLFAVHKGSHNLIYANSRVAVEELADDLRILSENNGSVGTFVPHHASLSKNHRSEVEKRLKEKDEPMNVVCTSTLELGIDIGKVDSIAQIGCPPSVSCLRQRLGRSARRGNQQGTLRMYIRENDADDICTHTDFLRGNLVQCIAMIKLMEKRWCEPPEPETKRPSTLVQQILSLAAERQAISIEKAWGILCDGGPFRKITFEEFQIMLRHLEQKGILAVTSGHSYHLSDLGKRKISNHRFYAAFKTPAEYRLVAEGKAIGTVPRTDSIKVGSKVVFSGRRWKILSIDTNKKVIKLANAGRGAPPIFFGKGFQVHDKIREEMHSVYLSSSTPDYLDETARHLLMEGRKAFGLLNLSRNSIIKSETDSIIFPWAGDKVINTITEQLNSVGISAEKCGMTIVAFEIETDQLKNKLGEILQQQFQGPSIFRILSDSKNLEAWDRFVPLDILKAEYRLRLFDEEGAKRVLAGLIN